MYRRIEMRYATFQPAAVGDAETKALFTMRPGERVIFSSARMEIAAAASSESTVSLGDGSGTASLIGAIDTEANAAGTIINGQGAYLNQSGGKLYTAADTVDAVYAVVTPGATNPKITFCIGTVRDW